MGVRVSSPIEFAANKALSTYPLPNFFDMALDGDILVGAASEAGRIKMYAVNLNTGHVQQIGSPVSGGVSGVNISGHYVTWGALRSVFVYDLKTGKEIYLTTNATDPEPSLSGHIVVWDGMQGYDINAHTVFSITSRFGAFRYPRVSGDWVISLDSINNGPQWGVSAKLYAHDLKTDQEFLIGAVPMGNGWQEFFSISGNRVAWLSAPNIQKGEQPKLHLFDLNTRTDRIIPTPIKEPDFPSKLRLDGDILLYGGGAGYDLSRDVHFSIPKRPSHEWLGAGSSPLLLSGNRLVWTLTKDTDQIQHLFMAQIIRGQ